MQPKRKRGRPRKVVAEVNAFEDEVESQERSFRVPSRHHSSPMILRSMMRRRVV